MIEKVTNAVLDEDFKYPKVSIITVVYNGINSVEKTINSVINQSYRNIEYIIIDGGSTDGTLDIIGKYRSRLAVVISEKDRGIADAMNKGISKATGELVGIINADDWYEEDAVNLVVEAARRHPGTIIHGNMRIYLDSGQFYVEPAPEKLQLKKGMVLNHSTVFVPRKIYQDLGVFDINYTIVFDWEMMLRYHLAGMQFTKIDQTLANFSSGGVSTRKPQVLIEEMHTIRRKYKTYALFDYYYILNRFRTIFFGSALIRVSQFIRRTKYKMKFEK